MRCFTPWLLGGSSLSIYDAGVTSLRLNLKTKSFFCTSRLCLEPRNVRARQHTFMHGCFRTYNKVG